MTPEQATNLVQRLLGAYPTQRQRMSREDVAGMVIAYAAGLADLEFDTARAAVDRCLKTSEYVPTIAKIRAELAEVVHGGKRSGAEAWGDVMAAVGRYGSHRDPVFDDPLVARAVRAIGWRAICLSDETDSSPRSKFADAYNAMAAGSRKDAQAAPGADDLKYFADRSDRALPVNDVLKQLAERAGSAEERSANLREALLAQCPHGTELQEYCRCAPSCPCRLAVCSAPDLDGETVQ